MFVSIEIVIISLFVICSLCPAPTSIYSYCTGLTGYIFLKTPMSHPFFICITISGQSVIPACNETAATTCRATNGSTAPSLGVACIDSMYHR